MAGVYGFCSVLAAFLIGGFMAPLGFAHACAGALLAAALAPFVVVGLKLSLIAYSKRLWHHELSQGLVIE